MPLRRAEKLISPFKEHLGLTLPECVKRAAMRSECIGKPCPPPAVICRADGALRNALLRCGLPSRVAVSVVGWLKVLTTHLVCSVKWEVPHGTG